MLSDGSQDMDGQLVGVRIINGHEFHARSSPTSD
jgi:hypothetical protein